MSGSSKVMSLEDAVEQLVRPGDHVHLGYNEARPNAAVLQLVRRFAGGEAGLTLSTGGLVSSQAALVSEGVIRKAIASFIGDNYPNGGPNPLFQAAIDDGRLEVEETSLWTLIARLEAGALGVPFLPVNSLTSSDLAAQSWVSTVTDPFGGADTTVVSALRPDVMLVHGVAADPEGNVILSPPYGESAWGALASARGVIATVEAIVSSEEVRRHQSLVRIPSHVVKAVCHVPLGAHPYGLYSPLPEVPGYVEDEAFILEQRRACKDAAAFDAWVAEWVRGTKDHGSYLELLGGRRIAELVGRAAPSAWSYLPAPADDGADASATERMVVAAAGHLARRLRTGEFDVLMTGIGFANLAAWLAHGWLEADGGAPPLMAEIGAYGYQPRPGDPFIFSHRNLPTCSWMTDVEVILGSLMAGDHGRSVAIVGAGNIDRAGNVNSNRTDTGGYLVGSGGANDIASGATELIVVLKHGRRRLVEQVPFVTCPGDRVRAIITDEAILERDDGGEFVLTTVLAMDVPVEEAVARAREGCGWCLEVASDVVVLPPPKAHDVQALRKFDPNGAFLGRRVASGVAGGGPA